EQLARQIPMYQKRIIDAVGTETWKGMDDDQQAALTSLVWNYGSLPDSVANAIKSGNRGQVASAIAALTTNADRRRQEASVYAGGASFDTPQKEQAKSYD